jgi:molybdopterin-guanine dinucleotide biosynthesis protein A
MAADLSRVAAVVLAGGRGERLGGRNKALLEIGGERLVDRALRIVDRCQPRLLAVGRTGFAVEGFVAVADLPTDYAGPLAGFTAAVDALRAAPAQWLLSLAVDTPFFPDDFLDRALAASADADVVVGCFGAQDYPTNALWRLAAIRTLPDNVRSGTAPRSLKRLAATLGVRRIDYAQWSGDDPFANANTPQDLENLRYRAARNNPR